MWTLKCSEGYTNHRLYPVMQISTDVIRCNACFCPCYEVQILSYLLNACSQGTRLNLMVAKLRCSRGTLSLIAKMKKSPLAVTCTNTFKRFKLHLLHQRYGFASEVPVGKIVTKKKSFFL